MTSGTMKEGHTIAPDMTVLDVVSRYRCTEAVFRTYEKQARVCLCCQGLFNTIGEIAERYGLDLRNLLADLEHASHLYPSRELGQ